MNNAEFIQQLAALNWAIRSANSPTVVPSSDSASSASSPPPSGEERARQIYALITGVRVVDEIFQRVTKKREIEQAWSLVVVRVADFVTKNPRASEKEQVEFVQKELKSFELYVNSL